ncbi:MAG: UvrD-helicase domain-containing protein [Methanoregulaceae archaeon]|jgi:ATP-dependent helicase/nuclease subunit A
MAATKRQNEAITTHDQSMVVTAGAGTGKTYVLVQKYLNLIETRGVNVPEILALTFTDKAAAEMRERIRKELSRREGRMWEKAAEDFMIAPVQTFHSFCAQVLREFPIEAGLEPGFVVLDERQESRIHARAFEELVHSSQPGSINEAVVHVLSISDQYTLRTMLSAMYDKRLSYDRFFAALDENEDQVVSSWMQEVNAFRDSEIRDLLNDRSFCSMVCTLLDLAARYEGADDKAAVFLGEIRPLLEQLSSLTCTEDFCCAASAILKKRPGNVGSRKVWKEEDLSGFKSARRNLTDILERKRALFRMTVDPSDPLITGSLQYLRELSRVFYRYKEFVEKEKATLGGLDFGDLILNARRLFLEQRELVATHFMPRFRYILVDEFQDTDITQFDIILSIIGTPTPETECLFIVGDPKQSIYLFRDADVTRFKEAQRIILSACQGRVVNLDTSFRSTKEVIGLTNVLFARLFASAEKPWEFGYEQILASDDRIGHAGSLELMLAPGGDDTAASKRNEADMVARRIYSLTHERPLGVYEETKDRTYVERPARYGDVAILLEQRTNLAYYLSALSSYGIPFYVHGGTGFYSRQEVYDLYNLLRFLEHRHDDISLAGALRSPYFGLPDTELFSIAQERGWTLWGKVQHYAENSGSVNAVHACDLLIEWRKYAGRISLVALIRRILSDSGIYTIYAALPDGRQILANVEKMVAMARVREEAGSYALADFTADLRTAMEDDEREGEAPLDALAENAVNIMTVHAAKGLEFPIVFVPDMGMRFREKFPPIMIGDNPLLVGIKVPDPDENYDLVETPVLAALREMQRQKERAEKKRLLYVALTRARDHLIMSGTAPENPELSINLATSRIEWIFSALGITGDSIKAGGMMLSPEEGAVRLTITSDPAAIPAETGKVRPELITVPEQCAGKSGTWTAQVFEKGPDRMRVYSVTELEKVVSPGVASPKESVASRYLPGIDGTTKGTIIHEVLRGRDARVVCQEYGVNDPEAVRQCEEIVARFRGSELMQRVTREFCELPFVVTVEGKRVIGKIDRLCELENGTWVVIDYKSEAVSPDVYPLKAEEYKVSMAVYVEAAQQLLLGKTVEGWLYFTEMEEIKRVVIDEERVR